MEQLKIIFRIVGRAGYRFYFDNGFSRASALAYTTLFALVPVATLSFTMLKFIGVDEQQGLNAVLDQILPASSTPEMQEFKNHIVTYIMKFVSNVASLGTVSVVVLIGSSIALLNTLESSINAVWRLHSNLGFVSKIASFWAVITLGPVLMGLSVFWSAKIHFADSIPVPGTGFLLPVLVTSFALFILYFKMPAARIRVRDALLGGLVAGVLFELLKRGFAYYMGVSTTYSALYGVIAFLPLFLFWLYLAYVVLLFGAEIVYQSGAVKVVTGLKQYTTDLGDTGPLLGLQILLLIAERFKGGEEPFTEGDVAVRIGADPTVIRGALLVLHQAGLISAPNDKTSRRVLTAAPDTITLDRVFKAFIRDESLVSEEQGALAFLKRFENPASADSHAGSIGERTLSEFL